MDWTDQKNDMDQVYSAVFSRLKESFSPAKLDDWPMAHGSSGWFQNSTGIPFSVHKMGDQAPWDFIVIEYADTGEDGEAYYPADYDNLENMIADMITEIEG